MVGNIIISLPERIQIPMCLRNEFLQSKIKNIKSCVKEKWKMIKGARKKENYNKLIKGLLDIF